MTPDERREPDDFLPIHGGGTTLYRPRVVAAPHDWMPGAHAAAGEMATDPRLVLGPVSPNSKNAEGSPESPPHAVRSQRVTWPEVDRRQHPANNVRPLVERRGPRSDSYFARLADD